MSVAFDLASSSFLKQSVSLTDVEKGLALLSSSSIEYADIYFQSSVHESYVLEDGIIKDGSYNCDLGVGVRALSGEKMGFAYCDEVEQGSFFRAIAASQSIAQRGQEARCKLQRTVASKQLYGSDNPLSSIPIEQKISILRAIDTEARKTSSDVKQVIASLNGVYEIVLIAATDGTLAADVRPLVRVNVSVVVERQGHRESASSGGGGRFGYAVFTENNFKIPRHHAREAVRLALVNLEAIPAPAGMMPVVLGPGWPGVLLHEAVGHGLEGDFNRKGSSTFAGRMGELVASKVCTVVDDGTLDRRRGSLNLDDEGTPTQRTVLIENGILKGYLQDKFNARLMNTHSTGNGRRESYGHATMPRMTNTFMLAGNDVPQDILQSVKQGLYAVNFGGGQVDITSGKFVFSASEAYLIENGRVTRPVKGATLIGNGPEVMTKISMVGNDLKLDDGVGTCGKDGQSVPVGVGQPTLKVDELTVGGTNNTKGAA